MRLPTPGKQSCRIHSATVLDVAGSCGPTDCEFTGDRKAWPLSESPGRWKCWTGSVDTHKGQSRNRSYLGGDGMDAPHV